MSALAMRRFSALRWTVPTLATLSIVGASLYAQAPFPPPRVPAKAAASGAELRAQLEAHVGEARFDGALWGVKIISLDTGRTLFEHHANRLLSPASNSKLYTGALALDRLGGDYRIVTPIFGAAKPDADGTIAGDVVVSGRGDPSWKAAPRGGDFWRTFEPFVAALRQAGVRHIAGDVVADATYFHGPPNGAGWTVDDFNDDYGAEISAITLEENYADLRVTPATVAGRACGFELLHPHTGLVIHNRTVTIAKGGSRYIEARRNPGENVVYVFGELPIDGADEILDLTVPRPAGWFAAALTAALVRGGIRVDGQPRSVRWPDASPVSDRVVKLGEITSPPLREIVRAFMKPSQNLETDLIFAHVGEGLRTAETPLWRTSEQLGVAALREFLQKRALPADEVRFEEGSGLSRNNLTTANATVRLLQVMTAHPEADAFFQSLPIAGVDGTIRRRMKGTAAEGNVHAKTGTLRWANSLSGYVTSAAGERLAFSLMLNRNIVPSGRFARDDLDSIAVMLARCTGRSDTIEVSRTGLK